MDETSFINHMNPLKFTAIHKIFLLHIEIMYPHVLQVYCLVLVGLSLPAPGHSFGILSEAINAFSCGCGCRFYDVGTCETRSKLECQVRRGSQMLNRMF